VLKLNYSKVRIGKHLSDTFHIQNVIKQGDAVSSLFFNFALRYAIRSVRENQLLVCANDVNLLADNEDNIKKTQKL
jgi:hypothetical protein